MADGVPIASEAVSGLGGSEEETLVARFVRGDASAFDQIVTSHQDRVARLAYRLLGWPDDVEDVVQDVFLSAWRHRRKFRGKASLSTWLTTITVNTCRTHTRKRSLLLRLARGHAPEARGSPALDANTLAEVRRAVGALPSQYREVVVLRYLEEMSAEKMGQVLGISANAAQVRLSRARELLRGSLHALVDEHEA